MSRFREVASAELEELLAEHGVSLASTTRRTSARPLELYASRAISRPFRSRRPRLCSRTTLGVFVAPPGVGKTVVGTYVAAARAGTRSSSSTASRSSTSGSRNCRSSSAASKAIGRIGGGKRTPTGRLDVAMIQSLVRDGAVDEVVAELRPRRSSTNATICRPSFERVLAEVKARYVIGSDRDTVPARRPPADRSHAMRPVRFEINPNSETARHPFEHRLICFDAREK